MDINKNRNSFFIGSSTTSSSSVLPDVARKLNSILGNLGKLIGIKESQGSLDDLKQASLHDLKQAHSLLTQLAQEAIKPSEVQQKAAEKVETPVKETPSPAKMGI